MSDLLYKLALTRIKRAGNILAKNLLSYCGSPEAVFKTSERALLKIPGIGKATAKGILDKEVLVKAEEELAFVEQYKIDVSFFTDDDFPVRLKNCYDGPILLYGKGDCDLNTDRMIAVVGTRKATDYGKDFCEALIQGLSLYNVVIVSGLAYGIDGAAHKAALKHGLKTIAVLGHGLNTIYPAQHKNLAKNIVEQGCLLTEYASTDDILPSNFPMRNRIVAGMTDLTIVVETKIRGGSVITANIANSYNRDVMALPGKHNVETSAGCNFLIKTHKAAVVESAEDVVQFMGWQKQKVQPKQQAALMLDLPADQMKITEALKGKEFVELDQLTTAVEMSTGKLAATLLELELNGFVASLPGKRYRLR